MAKIRGKLQAVHWGAAARGLPASGTAIETVKRDVFSRQLSEGQISVVAKCGSFVYNSQSQSKKQFKIDGFFLIIQKKNAYLLTYNKMCPSCFRFFVFEKGY